MLPKYIEEEYKKAGSVSLFQKGSFGCTFSFVVLEIIQSIH